MRILHAPYNMAGQASILASAQRELGQDVCVVEYFTTPFGYPVDVNLALEKKNRLVREIKPLIFFGKSLFQYEFYHFHFGGSLLLHGDIDLRILKYLQKKCVVHSHGSDVKQWRIGKLRNPYMPDYYKNKERDKRIAQRLEILSKYIDVIVLEPSLKHFVVDFFQRVEIIERALDVKNFVPHYPKKNKEVPLIIHAPSNRCRKGTKYILESINELRGNYKFDFRILENMLHKDCLKILAEADIVIDQLLYGTYGVFAIEAMALGKPVLCYIREDLREKDLRDIPIIPVTIHNLTQNLKYLIRNRELLPEIGWKSRKFAEEYHDSVVIAKQWLNLYRSL